MARNNHGEAIKSSMTRVERECLSGDTKNRWLVPLMSAPPLKRKLGECSDARGFRPQAIVLAQPDHVGRQC
ncbi:hypothetical protein GOBAR_DD15444 [Gossypium barbadense]|nr:hypothetical protein GOBAR_DD15444 [Gossypium barbadense]